MTSEDEFLNVDGRGLFNQHVLPQESGQDDAGNVTGMSVKTQESNF
jgi:hypothetical protein